MRYILIIFIMILTTVSSAAEFKKIETAAKGNINEIYFDNAAYGWAVTSAGELLSTFDGGQTWRLKEVSTRAINDVEFNDRLGYICGERGLLMKSTDRGATWQDLSMNIKFNFSSVVIANDSTVAVCGTDQNSIAKTRGVLFHSWDYGKHWSKAPRYGNGYFDLARTRPKKIYILAIKKVSHSINGGLAYFHGGYEGDRLGLDFDFTDDFGFMVGSKGLLARTMNHGRSWDIIDLDIDKDLFAVKIFNETSGVAVGQDGIVVFFSQGGQKIEAIQCGENKDLFAVYNIGNQVFVGGRDGTFYTTER